MDMRKYDTKNKNERIAKIREYRAANPGCTQDNAITFLIENDSFVKTHWNV